MAAIYDSPPLTRRQAALLLFACAALVLPPLGCGLNRYYFGYTKYGPAAASSWGLPWLLAAVSLLLITFLLWLRLLQRARFTVLVYQNGLRIGTAPRFSPPQTAKPIPTRTPILPWDAIAGIALDRVADKDRPPLHTLTLYRKKGRPIRIAEARSAWDGLVLFGPAHVQNLPELATRIKARLYPRLLPELRAAFLNDQCLHFGAVAVEKTFLHLPGRSPVHWSDVRRMTIRSGKLVVELGNPGKTGPDTGTSDARFSEARIPVYRIPNLELLFALVDDLVLPD